MIDKLMENNGKNNGKTHASWTEDELPCSSLDKNAANVELKFQQNSAKDKIRQNSTLLTKFD